MRLQEIFGPCDENDDHVGDAHHLTALDLRYPEARKDAHDDGDVRHDGKEEGGVLPVSHAVHERVRKVPRLGVVYEDPRRVADPVRVQGDNDRVHGGDVLLQHLSVLEDEVDVDAENGS